MVRRRFEANGCKCEGCGQPVEIAETAHLFGKGRSAKVHEKYASSPELMAALCCARTWGDRIGCHEAIDRGTNPELRERLRREALARFARRHRLDVPSGEDCDTLGALRQMVSIIDEREIAEVPQ